MRKFIIFFEKCQQQEEKHEKDFFKTAANPANKF